ncbi:heavy metal translocating P-type ATPase [Nocardioides montaniterrae]
MSTVDLELTGMTCASCANRIERKLNKLEGVTASVNYATERARVEFPPGTALGELIGAVEAAGYGASPYVESADVTAPSELDALRRRLLVSAALAVPVLLVAMVPPLQVTAWPWIAWALATPVATWGAWPFHRAALANLRHGSATMDTLVSTGVSAAYLWSVVALLVGDADMTYFETAAGVTTFLLAGRYAEKRAKRRAGSAMRALAALRAREVTLLPDGLGGPESVVPIERLGVGELFVVRPGERVATDGVVVTGSSAIDAAAFTGESVPVEVGDGDDVLGATLNTTGRLVVRATGVGESTQLAQIARLVEDAQAGKAAVQRLADRVSAVFVPFVIALSLATLAGWAILGPTWTDAFTAAVAVLIIACPCALGLATPTALMVGTARGAQLGILIRGPEVLEAARAIDTVALDKTGTVTEGRMRVVSVVAEGSAEDVVRRNAATVESASEHPIARAIAGSAGATGTGELTEFSNHAGLGVTGSVDGTQVVVGRAGFLREQGMTVPAALERAVDEGEGAGATVVLVGWEGVARGAFTVADTVAAGAATAVERLHALGQRVVLLTGDNERAARHVADQVGIDEVVAGVMPADKAAYVSRLQDEGRRVAMVGDGINDAAALAGADLGIAMGAGTDVAQAAADLTILGSDLGLAVDGIRLSRRTFRIIRSNLVWAFGYNVAALPLAVAGLATPMLAGAAMALSSVFVVGNSLRLRRFR